MKNVGVDKKISAFTLTDVLITLIIVGILVFLALPSFLPLVTKAKAQEAKIQLEHLYTMEKNYYYENSKYTTDLTQLNFEQQKLTTDAKDGRANYRIEISQADNTTFTARAVSVVDFNGDGKFNVWEINQDNRLTEVTKD